MSYSFPYLLGILIHVISETAANEAIIGGNLAGVDEFKYQVSLQIPGKGHICGGGIIHDYFILTAAHCVVKPDNQIDKRLWFVVAGTEDLRHTDPPAVISHVETIYVPVEFNPQLLSTTGDIAILKLKESLKISRRKNLKKLKFPSKRDKSYADKIAVIAAFGQYIAYLDHHEIKMSNELLFSNSQILSNRQCQDGYIIQKISDKHICARVKQYNDNAPRGTCFGDHGSPLVIKGQVVVGVLSLNPVDCEEKTRAGIYTRVSSYWKFISNAMNNKKTDDMRVQPIL